MSPKTAHTLRFAGTFWFCLSMVAGCYGPPAGAPPPGGWQQGPVEVGVVTLVRQSVPLTMQLPGRTAAYRVAEVRPQVSGVITKRLFREGAEVEAGEPLYQIDPAPFRASLASAQASLQRAQATLKSARALADRNQPLVAANAISQQDSDDAIAAAEQAAADVASAKAAVDTASINLRYTEVRSPIAGRTGRSTVTEGALVTASQATALVVVQQLDPIYVDVTQSSTALLALRGDLDAGRLTQSPDGDAAVTLRLEDGSAYPQTGKLRVSEVSVDESTGAVVLRAEFANPRQLLLPGMFVQAQLPEGSRDGLRVPQASVTRDAKGNATVLVVNAKNIVEPRAVQTERVVGADWLVTGGVTAGDRVVVSGLQKIKPGDEVKPSEAAPAAVAAVPRT